MAIPNKFKSPCWRCLKYVEAGEGLADKVMGRWQVAHVACPIPGPAPGLPPVAALRMAGLSMPARGHDYYGDDGYESDRDLTDLYRDPDEGDRG